MWETILTSALSAGSVELGKNLAGRIYNSVPLVGSFRTPDVLQAFSVHFAAVYQKCYFLKTILDDQPRKFSDLYAGQSFDFDGQILNQSELVSHIEQGNSVLIQGTGGSGKSMFSKLLWLYCFGVGKKYLPIFFELRALNYSSVSNIEDYIFHSCIENSKKFSQTDFSKSMKTGAFLLIIDGFDEIEIEKRDSVQSEVLRLKEKYPKLVVVLTSRPDERFSGWHQFSTIQVSPLNKSECLMVIKRAPYDAQEKVKLTKKVEESLFDSHRSFLSNPLLVYMTLVTYSYNPNFSDKMHEFYETAFDALYYRHDLAKGGGFKRVYHSGLSRTDLRRLISLFCFRTYFDQKTVFLKDDLSEFVAKSKEISFEQFGSVDEEKFIRDLEENLCFLKRDGINIEFTHRKLQEYFAAYCLSKVMTRNLEEIFERFSHRIWDEVISLCFDLNPDLVREKYLLPIYNRHSSFFALKRPAAIAKRFCELSKLEIDIRYSKQQQRIFHVIEDEGSIAEVASNFSILPRYSGEIATILRNLNNFNRPQIRFGGELKNEIFSDLIELLQTSIDSPANKVINGRLVLHSKNSHFYYRIDESFDQAFHERLDEKSSDGIIMIDDWRKTSIFEELKNVSIHFQKTINEEASNYQSTSDNIRDLLEQKIEH